MAAGREYDAVEQNNVHPSKTMNNRAAAQPLQRHAAYELFMLALCVYSIVSLGIARVVDDSTQVLLYADLVVSLAFFADFLIQTKRSADKWRYLSRWGWVDLVSSIPLIVLAWVPGYAPLLKLGRAFRAIRIIRALRAIRSTKRLATYILERRAESIFLAAGLLFLLLFVFSSTAVYTFEDSGDANIKTPTDAMWWALATIFNVNYGGAYPMSMEGRAVAALLAASGLCLFALFTGFFTSWFSAPSKAREAADLDDLRKELTALRIALEAGQRQE